MQIQQVVLNLLRNSVSALRKVKSNARTLRVLKRADGNSSIRLSVDDNGMGISTADQEPDFRCLLRFKGERYGFGVSICRTIVERHAEKLELVRSGSLGSRSKYLCINRGNLERGPQRAAWPIPIDH